MSEPEITEVEVCHGYKFVLEKGKWRLYHQTCRYGVGYKWERIDRMNVDVQNIVGNKLRFLKWKEQQSANKF